MASSSVSQDDVDVDFEASSRRTRIRTARARNIVPQSTRLDTKTEVKEEAELGEREPGSSSHTGILDHDGKPGTRLKEKRLNRPNHPNKGKLQRDRRKLREKRRSTGVVHLPSTESTGGSTGEEDELLSMNAETKRNTHYNENLEKKEHQFLSSRNKSPSDLEADDEDNQDYDSLTMSDSMLSLVQPTAPERSSAHTGEVCSANAQTANGKPPTPTYNIDEELEGARQENRRLTVLLEEREKRICSLELYSQQLSLQLHQATSHQSDLRQENSTLIRAMASLGTN